MLSLPRKQPSSGVTPDAGTVRPFGGVAPFPLVVLPGGGAAGAEKPPGREVFDAYVRRGTSTGLTPRQALVQALAGDDFPWNGTDAVVSSVAAPEAPASVRRMAISVPEEAVQATPTAKPAPAPAPVPAVAPAVAPTKAKLRIAARMSTPPFPMPASLPSGGETSPAQPEPPLSSLSPLAPVPSWNESDMGSPMLPIPEPKVVLAAGGGVTPSRIEVKTGPRAAWPVQPPVARVVGAAGIPVIGAANLSLHEAPKRRRLWPIMAAVLAVAVLLGVGEGWRRNARAKAGNETLAAPRLMTSTPPPAPVASMAPAALREPSEAFRAWARNARISGVREREQGQVRALVNGRLVLDGDVVDAALDLRLIGQNKAERRLIFEEGGGARLEVAY
jgi:hypothetical protein